MLEDISQGVESIIELGANNEEYKKSLRFFGTIILVNETNPYPTIQPLDDRGMPKLVRKVIDGQQRISTIALIATHLFERIKHHESIIDSSKQVKDKIKDELKEISTIYKNSLFKIFALDLQKGDPQYKPIIIRGAMDKWIHTDLVGEEEDSSYTSDISNYLAGFIRSRYLNEDSRTSITPKSDTVKKALSIIRKHVNDVEKTTYGHGNDALEITAKKILESIDQGDLWDSKRQDLAEVILNANLSSLSKSEKSMLSLTQLFTFSHYLMMRCCFNTIDLSDENLAFDMFQSLNSTGLPLTSLETFKPRIMNVSPDKAEDHTDYASSNTKTQFQKVEKLIKDNIDGKSKKKESLTNEFMVIFALLWNGEQMSKNFGDQRKYLDKMYLATCQDENIDSYKEQFMNTIGGLADYWIDTQFDNFHNMKDKLSHLKPEETDLIVLCITYLKKANHKMANSIISRFYINDIKDDCDAQKDFYHAVLAITAYFTLWRSVSGTSGLDKSYRYLAKTYFSMTTYKDGVISFRDRPSINDLKESLRNSLREKKIDEKDRWITQAKKMLKYDGIAPKIVIKFNLMVYYNNTSVDTTNPGLTAQAPLGKMETLTLAAWNSKDVDTLEHIAPQTNNKQEAWDEKLYEDTNYNQIGNLILLPKDLNSSVGNQPWREKAYYYRYLASDTEADRDQVKAEAIKNGMKWDDKKLKLFGTANYIGVLAPITEVANKSMIWDLDIVERRTEQICEAVWEKMNSWLS